MVVILTILSGNSRHGRSTGHDAKPFLIETLGVEGWWFVATQLRQKAERAALTRRMFRLGIYDVLNDRLTPEHFVGELMTDSDLEHAREVIDEYNGIVATWPGCTYTMALFEV
jgi:hypothetical protein